MTTSVIVFFAIAISQTIISSAIVVFLVRRDRRLNRHIYEHGEQGHGFQTLKEAEQAPGFQNIGDRFYYKGMLLEVMPSDYCFGCALKRKGVRGCIIPLCCARFRPDGQGVVFMEVK